MVNGRGLTSNYIYVSPVVCNRDRFHRWWQNHLEDWNPILKNWSIQSFSHLFNFFTLCYCRYLHTCLLLYKRNFKLISIELLAAEMSSYRIVQRVNLRAVNLRCMCIHAYTYLQTHVHASVLRSLEIFTIFCSSHCPRCVKGLEDQSLHSHIIV